MRDLVKIFKALSDPNRLRILKMLEIRPLCVCEITQVLELATSTVSKHLSLLRDADLIVDEKDGKWVNFRLNPDSTHPAVQALLPLLRQWLPEEQIVQEDARKVATVNREIICGRSSMQQPSLNKNEDPL